MAWQRRRRGLPYCNHLWRFVSGMPLVSRVSISGKMRDDLRFNIRFIELIESKPCLYDYNRPDYCNRNAQDAAWNEISNNINETVNDLKDRWKNIRGSYTKFLNKKIPSGSSAKSPKPYYLADNLRFLQPFTKSRKAQGNIKEPTDVNLDNNIACERDSSESDSEADAAPSCSSENAARKNSEALHITKKKKETNKYPSLQEVNASAFQYFQNKQKKLQGSSENSADDPDKAFLISVLPDMRKMTDYQKRKFKIGVLNLAGQILEGNESSSSSIQQVFSPPSDLSSNFSDSRHVYAPSSQPSPNDTSENLLSSYRSLQSPHLASTSEYNITYPAQHRPFH